MTPQTTNVNHFPKNIINRPRRNVVTGDSRRHGGAKFNKRAKWNLYGRETGCLYTSTQMGYRCHSTRHTIYVHEDPTVQSSPLSPWVSAPENMEIPNTDGIDVHTSTNLCEKRQSCTWIRLYVHTVFDNNINNLWRHAGATLHRLTRIKQVAKAVHDLWCVLRARTAITMLIVPCWRTFWCTVFRFYGDASSNSTYEIATSWEIQYLRPSMEKGPLLSIRSSTNHSKTTFKISPHSTL